MSKLLTCPECGSAKVRVSECSSYDANTVPATYGPFDVTFMGPGVWAGIPDELPPELVGKQVYVTIASKDEPVCDVCGVPKNKARHKMLMKTRHTKRKYIFFGKKTEYIRWVCMDCDFKDIH